MARFRLSGDVFLNPASLLRHRREASGVFPFNAEHVYYYNLGRTAIWHGVKVLGLKAGDEVLVPIYNCGTEIDPLLKAGLSLSYYDTDEQLNVRIADLENLRTEKTRAVYITHFFGFPQPVTEIKEFCERNNLYLVEDCAPALYSQNPNHQLGRFGDISIFSFRKTLPLADGSALVVNNKSLPAPDGKTNRPFAYSTHDVLYFIKGNYIYNHNQRGLLKSLITGLYELRANDETGSAGRGYESRMVGDEQITLLPKGGHFWPEKDAESGISRVAMRSIRGARVAEIVHRRRENYQYLLDNWDGIDYLKPVFTTLPDGICPLVFPVLVEDREQLRQVFSARDIALGRWWRFFHDSCPWEEFAQGVYLKNHLVSVPIHQDVNRAALDQLLKQLRSYAPANR
jgi:perosamine synthetase